MSTDELASLWRFLRYRRLIQSVLLIFTYLKTSTEQLFSKFLQNRLLVAKLSISK